MSEYDYREGMKIAASSGFYALLFAAIRKADLVNRNRLAQVFPDEVAEFEDWRCGRRQRMTEDAELAGRD